MFSYVYLWKPTVTYYCAFRFRFSSYLDNEVRSPTVVTSHQKLPSTSTWTCVASICHQNLNSIQSYVALKEVSIRSFLRLISIFLIENGSTLRCTQYIMQLHITYCLLYVSKPVLILLYKSWMKEYWNEEGDICRHSYRNIQTTCILIFYACSF